MTGCAEYIKKICRRLEKEHKLCPNNSHDFGDWGEWIFRRWRKSRKPYEVRFRVCKKCKKREMEISDEWHRCKLCGEYFLPEYKGAEWCVSCAEKMEI